MDPCESCERQPRRGLPRTRGDGPLSFLVPAFSRKASPHTRGWTRDGDAVGAKQKGFPAHAGMDRRLAVVERQGQGLPRTRGDGPTTQMACGSRRGASPHTRGWTRVLDPTDAELLGFPAHAGMDRAAARGKLRRPRLPRTRGDGPVSRTNARQVESASPHTRGWTRFASADLSSDWGFPAHAGMDP